MKSKLFLLILFPLFLISCQSQTQKEIQTVDAKVFSEKLKTTENPQLLDVRTPDEFAVEHIDNATNVDWNGDNFEKEVSKYDKSKPVFLYCKVGGRSAEAATKLSELGFTEIYNLKGGIMKWNANGFGKPTNKLIGMSNQEFSELLKSDKKTVINFYAKWCGPCKKMEPYLLKMKDELKDNIALIRLDADENKTLLDSMKLDGLPVILIYENQKEVWRNVGFLSEEDLRKHL